MGFLGKFFGRKNGEGENAKTLTSTGTGPDIYSLDLDVDNVVGESILAGYTEVLKTLSYNDSGMKTNLILAKIQRTIGTMRWDAADYVAFEIPENLEVSREIMQAVMLRYSELQVGDSDNQLYCLGRLQSSLGEGLRFKSTGDKSTGDIQNYVTKTIMERGWRITERKKQRGSEFKNELAGTVAQHAEKLRTERSARKESPYMIFTGSTTGKIANGQDCKYRNYEGVNIETGDILMLTKVRSVGVCPHNKMHLYSAYIESKTEERAKGTSFPICFELPVSLGKIKDKGTIRSVLELLSAPRNFTDSDNLSYIGRLDELGFVCRASRPSHEQVARYVERLQDEYENEKNLGR